MTQPVQNNCTPASVYGDYDQHLFLGCSVMSFSTSVGWNEQGSTLTVNLVQDPCAPPVTKPKKYWDNTLTQQNWTSADPGFFGLTYNIIGAPVYFRIGNFEFSGIVQSWDQSNAESGNPTYSVQIADPRTILDGVQLIINDYAGSVGSIYNLFNVFGYVESTGSGSCLEHYQATPGYYIPGSAGTDGTVFGSPAGVFGGADANNNGMQWNQIISGVRALTCGVPSITNNFSPYGRVVFKGPTSYSANGMGLMPYDDGSGLSYYFLDLSDMPIAPSYWRLAGTSTSLMDAVSQLCQDSGYDYYVELIPVVQSGTIYKFIKVRSVSRLNEPSLNAIDAFIANRQVISYNNGRELRNEPTSSFIIGGKKNSFYQITQSDDPEGDGQPTPEELDDIILPYFGVDQSGNIIVPQKTGDDDFWSFEAPALELQLQLNNTHYNKSVPASINVDEKELLAAESGIEFWITYASYNNTELWQALDVDLVSGSLAWLQIGALFVEVAKTTNNTLRPMDYLSSRAKTFNANDDFEDMEVCDVGFAWLKKYTTEYYARRYQVRVPFTCGRIDGESGIRLTSEQPSDGGYTSATDVLGLSHPSAYTDFFLLDDNRLGAFCTFTNPEAIQCSNLSIDDFIIYGSNLCTKIDVEPEYKYVDRASLFSPRTIITLPQQMRDLSVDGTAQNAWLKLVAAFKTGYQELEAITPATPPTDEEVEAMFRRSLEGIGAHNLYFPTSNRAVMPDKVGFGIQSNVLRYGPWASAGPAGAVSVSVEDGLVPWEYGGFTSMNLAGQALADAGITNMQVAEEGSITVAGYPELPLGSELLAADAGGPYYSGGTNLVENRTISSGSVFSNPYYWTNVAQWSGGYGPNVTSITTNVGDNGLQTTYNLRVWTPKFGLFAKKNAERIKQIGSLYLSMGKQLSTIFKDRITTSKYQFLQESVDREAKTWDEGVFKKPNSPHEILTGQLIDWNNGEYKRPLVASISALELPIDLESDYDKKAFMSLDGLLRPVSVNGSGGLPRYVYNSGDSGIVICTNPYTNGIGMQPPVNKEGEGFLYYSYDHYNGRYLQKDLNPFATHSGWLVNVHSDTKDHGHDIEIVGRDNVPPASSMLMPVQGYADTQNLSQSDYPSDQDSRVLALRGPLLMQGWGYDTDGKPVPNKIDTTGDASRGIFSSRNLEDKFMDDWLRHSNCWPVAPVDLRLDRRRGVWTVPQYRPVVAMLKECWDGSNGEQVIAEVVDGPELYDDEGNIIDHPEIFISDLCNERWRYSSYPPLIGGGKSGDIVIAQYDPYNCRYNLIQSSNYIKISGPTHYIEFAGCTGDDREYILGGTQYMVDEIEFGNGFCVTRDTGDCTDTAYITAGIEFSDEFIDVPVSIAPCSGDLSGKLINRIHFGRGLHYCFQEGSCEEVWLGAGVTVRGGYGDDIDCDVLATGSGWDAYVQYDTLIPGPGIAFHRSQNELRGLVIQGGIGVSNGGQCIMSLPSVATNRLYSNLQSAKGLTIRGDASLSCGASIGLAMDITGPMGVVEDVAELAFGECFNVEPNGSCGATISLKGGYQSYSPGDVTAEEEFISSITPICCTGGGMRGVQWVIKKLRFNSCGQTVDIVVGNTGSGVCSSC